MYTFVFEVLLLGYTYFALNYGVMLAGIIANCYLLAKSFQSWEGLVPGIPKFCFLSDRHTFRIG